MKTRDWMVAGRLVLALLALAAFTPSLAWAQDDHGAGAGAEHNEGAEHDAEAAASSHEPAHEGGVPVNDLIEALFNFAIFLAVLVYFLRRPISEYMQKRSRGVSSQLDEAAAIRKQAEEKLAEYKRRLEEFDREREKILANYRKEAEEEQAEILADARKTAERVRADAHKVIEFELKGARTALRERIVAEAVTQARAAIEQRLDEKTRERLVREYIDTLARLKTEARN